MLLRKHLPAAERPFRLLVGADRNDIAGARYRSGEAGQAYSASFVDPLTELGNARHLKQTVCALAAERASDPAPFTIALANLDGFKPINDLFGPEAGDQILRQVAHRLKACVPEGATVTRTADDEFAMSCRWSLNEGVRRSAARC